MGYDLIPQDRNPIQSDVPPAARTVDETLEILGRLVYLMSHVHFDSSLLVGTFGKVQFKALVEPGIEQRDRQH
jgi:hypothetical protein